MTPREKRIAILEMHKVGTSVRTIAQTLKASRNTVRAVITSRDPERAAMQRESQLAEHIERIRELHAACKGNLVRVHEELERAGVVVAYTTLTEFCREQKIGVIEKVPAGKYHFQPGVEMQHDTSPHRVTIGDVQRILQVASVVLPHSRMIFAQAYVAFTRFHCQTVEVHETIRHIRIFHRHKLVAEHPACEPGANKKSTLPEHRREPGASRAPAPISAEETTLVAAGPEFVAMIALLRTKYHGQAQRAARRLHTLFLDFPTPVLRAVLIEAVEHRAHDLGQVERLVLQRVGADVFRFPIRKDEP